MSSDEDPHQIYFTVHVPNISSDFGNEHSHYLSSSFNESAFDYWRKQQTPLKPTLMFLAGLIGNLIAFVVIVRSPSAQSNTPFYRIVTALVMTDLAGTLLTSPIVIAVYDNGLVWIGGRPLCLFFSFVMTYNGCATLMFICALSLERFACITKPYFYYTRIKANHSFVPILISCFCAGVVAILPILGVGTYIKHFPGTWCFFDYYSSTVLDKTYCYIFSIVGLLCIFATCIFNILVLKALISTCLHPTKKCRRPNGFNVRQGKINGSELEMVVLLIVMTATICCCYGPLLGNVLRNAVGLAKREILSDLLIIRLASLNQILDPWVYILVRRRCLTRCKRWICRKKHHAYQTYASRFSIARSSMSATGIYRCESSPTFSRCMTSGTMTTSLSAEMLHHMKTLQPIHNPVVQNRLDPNGKRSI